MKIANILFNLGNSLNINETNKHKQVKKIYEKDDQKALEEVWKAVGNAMKSVLYGDKHER